MLFASFAGDDAWRIKARKRYKRRLFGEQLNVFGRADCCRCGVFSLAEGVFSVLFGPQSGSDGCDAETAENVGILGCNAENKDKGSVEFEPSDINIKFDINSVSCDEQNEQDGQNTGRNIKDDLTECGDGECEHKFCEQNCERNCEQNDNNNSDIESVIARNASTVYKLAMSRCGNRADADDIFQQVFLRYITRRPDFASAAHEKAWFLRVTVNCSKSFWSSAFRRNTQPMTEEMAAPRTEEHGLWAAVAAMPEKYRVLIHLFYYEGISTAEISQLLNRKESTVRMQLTRARRLLGERLKGEYDEIEF